MRYYQVITGDVHDPKTGYTTVLNELLTASEILKKFPSLDERHFIPVSINKNHTHFFFGARFADSPQDFTDNFDAKQKTYYTLVRGTDVEEINMGDLPHI
jgi:hypothetical protein